MSKQPSKDRMDASRGVDVWTRLVEYRACLSRESNYPHWGTDACYMLKSALKWFDETFPEVKDGSAGQDQG